MSRAKDSDSRAYPVSALGIGPEEAAMLRRVGIRTTAALLEAAKSPRGRKELAARTGISPRKLLAWANGADLLRIKGIGKDYAALLPAAGVATVRELLHRNPAKLAARMAKANEKHKLVAFLPSEKAIQGWIERAKELPLKITYD